MASVSMRLETTGGTIGGTTEGAEMITGFTRMGLADGIGVTTGDESGLFTKWHQRGVAAKIRIQLAHQ